MTLTNRLLGGCAVVFVLGAPGAGMSQTAPPKSAEVAQGGRIAGGNEIAAVVVTAERRAENVQKVPIAITAIEGATLDSQGIVGFKELSNRVPSLRFGAGVTGGENVITMRGLGSQNTTPGGDSPVAYNFDGVYLQQTTAVDPEFYDVSRIEVLRGPQGTLYGRNSVGGSINIITNKPTEAFSAGADALYGNYEAYILRGFINGVINRSGDTRVTARVTGVISEHSPYATNLSTASSATHNQDGGDYKMMRGQVSFDFSPKVNLLLAASASWNDDPAATNTAWWQTPARYVGGANPIPLRSSCDFSTQAKFTPRIFCHDAPENASNRVQVYSATLNWELSFAQITSVTAYSKSKVNQTSDGDGSNQPIAVGAIWTLNTQQISQEIRVASRSTTSPVRWLAGFIYFYSDNYENFAYVDTGYNDVYLFPGGLDKFNFFSHGFTKTQSFAPFGQIDYDLSKTHLAIPLTITAGLRYSHDHKYGYNFLDYQLPNLCGGSCANPQGMFSNTWGQVTGRFGLNYQFTDHVMGYASVSRGYLAGGNIIGLAHVYGPETLWSYEAGFKSRFFDNRLQLNMSAYREAIDNLQVFVQSSTQSGINNVNGTTYVDGLENELTAVPVSNLRLNATVTLTDAKYGRYITTATRFGGPGPGCAPVTLLCNFQGNELNQTPPYTLDFGAQYTFQTAVGTITPRVDSYFSGRVQFLPDNYHTSTQPAYNITNLHLTWVSENGRFIVDGFVNNVGNVNVISNDGLQSVSLGQQILEPDNFVYAPPRTYGLRIGVKFGNF